MSSSTEQRRSFSLRIKITLVSILSFIVTSACSLMQSRTTPTPVIMCYIEAPPTNTPTPIVLCYDMVAPTETPFTSPLSPLPTPTPTSTPEARRLLLDRLIAEGRLPRDVARQLQS